MGARGRRSARLSASPSNQRGSGSRARSDWLQRDCVHARCWRRHAREPAAGRDRRDVAFGWCSGADRCISVSLEHRVSWPAWTCSYRSSPRGRWGTWLWPSPWRGVHRPSASPCSERSRRCRFFPVRERARAVGRTGHDRRRCKPRARRMWPDRPADDENTSAVRTAASRRPRGVRSDAGRRRSADVPAPVRLPAVRERQWAAGFCNYRGVDQLGGWISEVILAFVFHAIFVAGLLSVSGWQARREEVASSASTISRA
jgi:hypothetical protein